MISMIVNAKQWLEITRVVLWTMVGKTFLTLEDTLGCLRGKVHRMERRLVGCKFLHIIVVFIPCSLNEFILDICLDVVPYYLFFVACLDSLCVFS